MNHLLTYLLTCIVVVSYTSIELKQKFPISCPHISGLLSLFNNNKYIVLFPLLLFLLF